MNPHNRPMPILCKYEKKSITTSSACFCYKDTNLGKVKQLLESIRPTIEVQTCKTYSQLIYNAYTDHFLSMCHNFR